MRFSASQGYFLLFLVIVMGVAAIFMLVQAWTGPAQSPPNGNVAAPINTGGTAQTKSGNLTVNQLTAAVATGTAPFVLTSGTKVANLNADMVDGLDSSAFGDATAANQTTILSRIGTSGDAAGTGSLFAHAARLYNQIDNGYSAGVNVFSSDVCDSTDVPGCVPATPTCPSGWTDLTGAQPMFGGINNSSGHVYSMGYRACALAR